MDLSETNFDGSYHGDGNYTFVQLGAKGAVLPRLVILRNDDAWDEISEDQWDRLVERIKAALADVPETD